MKWRNLKNNKCPQCTSSLMFEIKLGNHLSCTKCNFGISMEKFEKIVNDLYKPKPIEISDNQQSLSDL